MLIPALVAAATTALLGVTAYLLTHPESTVRSLEHEVDRICREARYGWEHAVIARKTDPDPTAQAGRERGGDDGDDVNAGATPPALPPPPRRRQRRVSLTARVLRPRGAPPCGSGDGRCACPRCRWVAARPR